MAANNKFMQEAKSIGVQQEKKTVGMPIGTHCPEMNRFPYLIQTLILYFGCLAQNEHNYGEFLTFAMWLYMSSDLSFCHVHMFWEYVHDPQISTFAAAKCRKVYAEPPKKTKNVVFFLIVLDSMPL